MSLQERPIPATNRVLNLNRGRLAIGSPADVTLFDTGPLLDLRRQSLVFEKPQFAF